jgi:hypothetical protein
MSPPTTDAADLWDRAWSVGEMERAGDALAAEVRRLRGALIDINRRASPSPERTVEQALKDLYWCACEARRVLP